MTTLAPTAITFERILVPTDFSDASQHALEYAKSIARKYQSQLFLLHVNQPINPITPPEAVWIAEAEGNHESEQQLEETRAALRSEGFRAEAVSVTGIIRDEVISVIQENKIDLIVMGTHGRTGVERFLFGSDTEDLLRHVRCPVIAIGPKVEPYTNQAWQPKRLICATTLEPELAWIAAYAYRLSVQYQTEFMLFNVEDPTHIKKDPDAWLLFENAFKKNLSDGAGSHVSLRTLFSNRVPGEKIVDAAKKHHADLIVMGARTAPALAAHSILGTVPQVVAEARCPVMTLLQK